MAAGVQRRGGPGRRRSPEPRGRRPIQPAASISLPGIATLDSLEEISGWLGTYRQRLKIARSDEQLQVGTVVSQLESRMQLRRAELV